ncbi:MAG: hypothetical protein IPM11_01310 [Micropruina sp.]|nr:hypothetical protein [Micropruina sp.]
MSYIYDYDLVEQAERMVREGVAKMSAFVTPEYAELVLRNMLTEAVKLRSESNEAAKHKLGAASPARTYRRKRETVEALQVTGIDSVRMHEYNRFVGVDGNVLTSGPHQRLFFKRGDTVLYASIGDFIVRHDHARYSVRPAELFNLIYEAV